MYSGIIELQYLLLVAVINLVIVVTAWYIGYGILAWYIGYIGILAILV